MVYLSDCYNETNYISGLIPNYLLKLKSSRVIIEEVKESSSMFMVLSFCDLATETRDWIFY
jgi:hypothetical protein